MADIAESIGIFIMALIIIGIPFISGIIINDNNNSDNDAIEKCFVILSGIDLLIVCILINHCM